MKMYKWIIIGIAVLFGGKLYYNFYHKKIKSYPKRYCYSIYNDAVNNIYIVSKDNRSELKNYYDQMDDGVNPVFQFPIKDIPYQKPVYIIKYSKDSTYAKIATYYSYGPINGYTFSTGWVLSRFIHETPYIESE